MAFSFLNLTLFNVLQATECCEINVSKHSTGHQYSHKMMPSAESNKSTMEDTMVRKEESRKRVNSYWSIHFHLFAAILFLVAFAPPLLCSTELNYQPCPLSDQLSISLAKFKAHESKFFCCICIYLNVLLVFCKFRS